MNHIKLTQTKRWPCGIQLTEGTILECYYAGGHTIARHPHEPHLFLQVNHNEYEALEERPGEPTIPDRQG